MKTRLSSLVCSVHLWCPFVHQTCSPQEVLFCHLISTKAVLSYSFKLLSANHCLFFPLPKLFLTAQSLFLCRSRSRSRSRSGDRGRRGGGRSSGYRKGASSSRSPSLSLPVSRSPSPSSRSAQPATTAVPDKQRKWVMFLKQPLHVKSCI